MYFKDKEKQCICQGDIFQDFKYNTWIELKGNSISVDSLDIPFFVVLTQACDLKQDFTERTIGNQLNSDKIIQSILVCPAYLADEVREGKHLEKSFGIESGHINGNIWSTIKSNNHKRFHFLEGSSLMGLPDLVIDFKQYYTIPLEKFYGLYKSHYVCSMNDLFRENVSHRFAFYLSRIGLPNMKI